MSTMPMVDDAWRQAREVVAVGGVVAFPTDTVYGIGCDPYNVEAISRIYTLKGRDVQKAIPLLLSGPDALALVTSRVPDAALALGERFWPGALTLVVPRAQGLPPELGGGETIAVRVPDHTELRVFIASCGGCIAATSANLSGRPDALDARQVESYFDAALDLIVDGGPVRGGVPSTVVDCVAEPPTVLRVGALSESDVESVLNELTRE